MGRRGLRTRLESAYPIDGRRHSVIQRTGIYCVWNMCVGISNQGPCQVNYVLDELVGYDRLRDKNNRWQVGPYYYHFSR